VPGGTRKSRTIRFARNVTVMSHEVTSVSNSIRIMLSTPSDEYPLDALVPATVRVQNLSRESVLIEDRGFSRPEVRVEDRHGALHYRSNIPIWDPPSRGGVTLEHHVLRPGATLEQDTWIVCRADLLRAHVRLYEPLRDLIGDALVLRLVHAAPPPAHVDRAEIVQAILQPPPAPESPLMYVSRWRVLMPDGTTHYSGSIRWTDADGHTIAPEWNDVQGRDREWQAMAGWAGLPVARIEYREGAPIDMP
jgi:hypothetical protein